MTKPSQKWGARKTRHLTRGAMRQKHLTDPDLIADALISQIRQLADAAKSNLGALDRLLDLQEPVRAAKTWGINTTKYPTEGKVGGAS